MRSGLEALDGTLNISLIGGFTPLLGQSIVILTFGSVSGDFANYTGFDIGGGLILVPSFEPPRLPTSPILTVAQP